LISSILINYKIQNNSKSFLRNVVSWKTTKVSLRNASVAFPYTRCFALRHGLLALLGYGTLFRYDRM
jgi:ABC-type iron transport system FetAB permease component